MTGRRAGKNQAEKAASRGLFSLERGGGSLLAFDLSFGKSPLCGLDEAGRGPLAGPLAAAAVILDPEKTYPGVDDSKKLTPQVRESLYEEILQRALAVEVALKSPGEVDELNPLKASMLAMREAFLKLQIKPALCLADGNVRPPLPCEVRAVVKGDSLSLCVAAASVVAKVTRDRIMLELDGKYPRYGFARHKGYPTREHYEALRRYGPCPEHRLSYRGVLPEGGKGGGTRKGLFS
ncbi:MAG: ribonuclease HII [Deltaproteobacteria bacterium]|jgi:ribonuclease HII|nr:ribonuclease HII [Deltaproteobacteria bacterium]